MVLTSRKTGCYIRGFPAGRSEHVRKNRKSMMSYNRGFPQENESSMLLLSSQVTIKYAIDNGRPYVTRRSDKKKFYMRVSLEIPADK